MNEREWEVLQQYDLAVKRISRSRGAFLCETSRGMYLLKETTASEERLQWEDWILGKSRSMDRVYVDEYIPNKEGLLISRSADFRRYFLRVWDEGRECEKERQEDVLAAAESLALLHQRFEEIKGELNLWEAQWRSHWEAIRQQEQEKSRFSLLPCPEEEEPVWKKEAEEEERKLLGRREQKGKEDFAEGKLSEERMTSSGRVVMLPDEQMMSRGAEMMQRRCRELIRARNYIKKIRKKSKPEQMIWQGLAEQLPQAEAASRAMGQLCLREDGLCHGNYVFHQLYRKPKGLMITGFDRMRHGIPQDDLYQLMIKVLEHRNWDPEVAAMILQSYERILPLNQTQKQYLYLRFSFPEKFWKQVNFYLNHRKSWISARTVEKLFVLETQQRNRMEFLCWMEEKLVN